MLFFYNCPQYIAPLLPELDAMEDTLYRVAPSLLVRVRLLEVVLDHKATAFVTGVPGYPAVMSDSASLTNMEFADRVAYQSETDTRLSRHEEVFQLNECQVQLAQAEADRKGEKWSAEAEKRLRDKLHQINGQVAHAPLLTAGGVLRTSLTRHSNFGFPIIHNLNGTFCRVFKALRGVMPEAMYSEFARALVTHDNNAAIGLFNVNFRHLREKMHAYVGCLPCFLPWHCQLSDVDVSTTFHIVSLTHVQGTSVAHHAVARRVRPRSCPSPRHSSRRVCQLAVTAPQLVSSTDRSPDDAASHCVVHVVALCQLSVSSS